MLAGLKLGRLVRGEEAVEEGGRDGGGIDDKVGVVVVALVVGDDLDLDVAERRRRDAHRLAAALRAGLRRRARRRLVVEVGLRHGDEYRDDVGVVLGVLWHEQLGAQALQPRDRLVGVALGPAEHAVEALADGGELGLVDVGEHRPAGAARGRGSLHE